MTQNELHDALVALHDPDAWKKLGHVTKLWEDGEVTSEKCGDLYGQRTMHMVEPGVRNPKWTPCLPSKQSNGHSFVMVPYKKQLEMYKLRIELLKMIGATEDDVLFAKRSMSYYEERYTL